MPSLAVVPALALIAGAVCGSALGVPPSAALWILPLALVGAAAAYLADCRPAFVAFTVAAFWWGACALAADARQKALDTPLRLALDREFGGFAIDTPGPGGRHDPIRVTGVLAEDAARSDDLVTMRVRVTRIEISGTSQPVDGVVTFSVAGFASRPSRPGSAPGEALLRRPGSASGEASADPASGWVAGRTLEMMATFRRPARYLDEGVPDFERDLALSGTTLFGSVKSGLLVDVVADGNAIQEAAGRVRRHVRRALNTWIAPLDPLSAAIVAAVLIGDRTGLPDDIRVRLQAAGTYHVIAISGGNIAILAGLSFGLLFLCGLAGRTAALVTLLLLVAYAEVVTAGASVWRATLMAALYLAARVFDHRSPAWHAMGVAAALVVCARPLDVRDAGFILTFGATAALLEAARRVPVGRVPPLAKPRRTRRTDVLGLSRAPLRWLVASLVASAAAEVVLLPVSAWSFSRVTSAGLVLNLVAVPLMSIVQIAGTVVSLADSVGVVAHPAGWSAHLAARGIVWSSQLVDVVPWLTTLVPPPSFALVLVYYAGLAATLLCRRWARAIAILVLVVAGIAIASGARPAHGSPEPGRLRLTVFDVGQGDAQLLELPDRSTLQIDAGGIPFGSSGFDMGARVLAPALWARGVRQIDTLLLTHGDPDHIGGARSVIDDFGPATIWEGIPVGRHIPMRELLAHASERGSALQPKIAGEQLESGGVRIRVLHPPTADWERRRVRNDDSVVLEIIYGDVAILLTGDIGADIERAILPQLTAAKIRVLKVAHHGSRTSSSAELLEGWRPDIAIISCGRGNSFGHPATEVLERLKSVGAEIYRTDLDGQVTVDTDGRKVSVSTFAGGAR